MWIRSTLIVATAIVTLYRLRHFILHLSIFEPTRQRFILFLSTENHPASNLNRIFPLRLDFKDRSIACLN
jgi:hypothetical protein